LRGCGGAQPPRRRPTNAYRNEQALQPAFTTKGTAMKNYVLDTTVLLYDPQALYAFQDNCIVVPITVIEDIDKFKKDLSETGRNARQTSRHLDELRAKGRLSTGVTLPSGGSVIVRIATEESLHRLPREFRTRDAHILAIALEVKSQSGDTPTVIVSKDTNLRIKADAFGLMVEDYESDKVDIEELYPGHRECLVDATILDAFMEEGFVPAPVADLFPNEYVALIDAVDASHLALARFDQETGHVLRLASDAKNNAWRVKPQNREQFYALDALLSDEIQLVTLVGKAGTGKTLLAVAASLYKTVDENSFSRILVSRPTQPMGKDIGFLPGDVEQKLLPWMYPIADNVEYLMRSEGGKSKHHLRGFKELVDMGVLIIEPLTYIRGRSIHNQYLIVDEAQNLTPHELKTIITRVGDGTKIVVTGDPYQIDNPYIDACSNGLTYVVEKFKDQAIAAHVTLTKGERSELSELAANLL